ncbi:MAG: ribosomal protein S18-alanine N-acetyltransferase [Myxococcales bacterium]
MRRPQSSEQAAESTGPFRLRRLVPADLDEVLRIEQAAFAHPWTEELMRRELTHAWSTILVAEEPTDEGDRIRGFIIFWLVHDEVHILNVATDPAHLRRGVAKALIGEALRLGKRAGAALATLEVRRTNTPAIKLYERFGFRIVGVRPNYYADENEDGFVMLLDLP